MTDANIAHLSTLVDRLGDRSLRALLPGLLHTGPPHARVVLTQGLSRGGAVLGRQQLGQVTVG